MRVLPEDIVHQASFGTNLLMEVMGPGVAVVVVVVAAAVAAVEHEQERDIVFVLLAADVLV